MRYSALQTRGILAINCQTTNSTVTAELLIVNNPELAGTITVLYPTVPKERNLPALRVKIPEIIGLYKQEILTLCP
jgi:hypothetical protein